MINYFLFEKINQFAGKWSLFDALGVFLSDNLGYILAFFLIFLLIKNYRKYKEMVSQAFFAGILARLGIVELIRFLFPNPRPFVENSINLLVEQSASSSFPSGHASFYFALAAVIYFYDKKLGGLFLIAAFLISISRVFVGIHWPADVFAGAVVGILSAWLIIKISGKKKKSQ